METILEEAHRLTSGDRREQYGHPLDDYTRTSGLFNAMFAHKLKSPFSAEEMQLVMVLVKMSRLAHELKRDSLVDAAGYLRTVEMTQDERKARASE